MTQQNIAPPWSVQDARSARAAAELKQGPIRRALSPSLARATRLKQRMTAAIVGNTAYNANLSKVAQHMNRNRDAFAEYTPYDVVVSAYFKAGTNWIMHVCHQICHYGVADFKHIQDVIPWPDAAEPRFWVNVHDESARQTPTGLRVIKSQLPASKIPITAAAKYIAVTRDPKDCAASAYHFFKALVFGATMPPPDVWLAHFRSEEPNFGRWDVFTDEWYKLRESPNVLFLCFEDVKQDSRGAIVQIAEFLEISLTDEQLESVHRVTSVEAMKAINHKFYPARQSNYTDPSGKIIRKGVVGESRNLFTDRDLAQFDDHWRDVLVERKSKFPYTDRYAPD